MKATLPVIFKAPYKFIRNSFLNLFIILNFLCPTNCFSQCTNYTVNWDNLDYLHNANSTWYGLNNPTTTLKLVTDAMKQSQNFAMGPTNSLNISTLMTVAGSGGVYGDLTTHSGDVPGYTGADVSFIPTTGQTITLTFLNEVTNASFTLYDIDRSSIYNITAVNASNVAQPVTATTYATSGTSIITVSGSPGKTLTASTAPAASISSPDNKGTATISVAGPVKSITITATAIGTDAQFWLSDIISCVSGSGFTSNYYQTYTQPYTGQPGYFLVNPDFNLNVYMVDPVNATADLVFSDPGTVLGAAPAGIAMNSLAYDPVNHVLYYAMNGASNKWTNRAIKKYDFNTNTISTVIDSVNTLGIPTFIQGTEAAAAAFYDGSLYLGIEGLDPNSLSSNTESVIWRIDFDESGQATRASQVFGTPGDVGGQPTHDWGDFIIKDGTLITHASTQISPSYQSGFTHLNMVTNTATNIYTAYADTAGQIGQLYNGAVYRIDNQVAVYNENGTTGTPTNITVTSCSPSWNNRPANDISCPFRPALDFGDAPSSYDPVALSPAANQRACNNATLRIGSVWDREWTLTSSSDASSDGSDEDGISTVTILVSDGASYNHVQDVTVLNNTGFIAYLAAWLDYDANGLFDASEGVVMTVPTSASPQTLSLGWIGITVAPGTPNTFLRVRLYSGILTTNNATGWLNDGETEDYPVVSQASPLLIELLNFNATLTRNKDVLLNWIAYANEEAQGFEVLRSIDQVNWEKIGWINTNTERSTAEYNFLDEQPFEGKSYYRLKMVEKSGSSKYSKNRLIQLDQLINRIKIYPNPAKSDVTISLNGSSNQTASLNVLSVAGEAMMKKTIFLNQGMNRFSVPIDRLSNGIYIIEIVTPEKTFVNKLTIAH